MSCALRSSVTRQYFVGRCTYMYMYIHVRVAAGHYCLLRELTNQQSSDRRKPRSEVTLIKASALP